MLGPVRKLTTRMNLPTEYDRKCLTRLTRYLIETKDFGLLMSVIEPKRYHRGVVLLDTYAFADWVGGAESLESVVCCYRQLDGCCISTIMGQQP